MKRVTISVADDLLQKAQRAVESGTAESVSGWFAQLAEREPDWSAARAVVDELVSELGGLSDEERAWARQVLGLDTGQQVVA